MFSKTTATKKIIAMSKRVRAVQGGTCLAAGTKVLTDKGHSNVEDIKKGTRVLSLSPNLGIVASEVTSYWENPPNKPIIVFSINGETYKQTYDHKFYTAGEYKELYKIVWGDMEAGQRAQLELLCQQYGQDFDVDPSWRKNSGNYETGGYGSEKQEDPILDGKDGNGREIGVGAQSGGAGVAIKSPKSTTNRSQERGQFRQQGGQPGVGDAIREHQEGIQVRVEGKDGGRKEPQGQANGQAGDTNKEGVGHNTQAKQETTGHRLWGVGSEHQRYSGTAHLQAFRAEQIQIQQPEKTFAFSVNSGNYFIGGANLNVSNSASKTISILLYLIARAQADETPTLTSIVSESFPHLRRGAMRDFLMILKEHHYYQDSGWNKSESTYTFETGSKIEFFSADQGDKLRGARRDRLFINEANNITFEAFEQLEVRTKDFIFLDWNPTCEFWFYSDVLKRDDVEHITLTYKDNEALSKEIVDAIEQRKNRKGWWQVYGLGQLGEVEGRIYKDWQIIDEIPHEARLERRGLDFGFSADPSAAVEVYYYNGGYILDEILFMKGLSNRQIANSLLDKPEVLTIADSAEPKSIDEIRNYGVNIIGATKGRDSVTHGIQTVQDQRISMTKRSTNLIKAYRNYLWATDKTGKILNEPDHTWSDIMDAVRYAFSFLPSVVAQDREKSYNASVDEYIGTLKGETQKGVWSDDHFDKYFN